MVLVAENTAEGGTPGNPVAAGTSGSGNAWDAVVNVSNVLTWDTTHVDYGSIAIKVAMLAAVCRCSWTATTLGTRTELYYAGNFYFTGSPTTSCHFIEGVTSGAAQAFAVDIASTGKMFVRNSANTNVYTSTNLIPVNSYCRVEVHYIAGNPGTLQVWLYTNYTDPLGAHLETTGPLSTSTGSDVSRLDFGAMTSNTALPAFWIGDQRVGDAAGGQLGPVGGAPVTLSLTAGASLAGSGTPAPGTSPLLSAGATLAAAGSTAGSIGLTPGASLAAQGGPSTAGGASFTASATLSRLLRTQQWLANESPLDVAHRGGDADWVEMTRYAYSQAIAYGAKVLNVDGWMTTDGVWVASHDNSLLRVFGVNVNISDSTWDQIKNLTTTTGGYPIEKVADLLAAFPQVLWFVENKHASSLDASFLNLLDAGGGPDRIIVKAYYTAATVAADAHARGYLTWGYYYPADLANFSSTHSRWDILGLDFTDTTPADWAMLKATGKKVIAHVIMSVANANQAFAEGADGVMTGKVIGVIPPAQASLALTAGASLAGTGLPASGQAVMVSAGATLGVAGQLSTGGPAGLTAGASVSAAGQAAVATAAGISAGATLDTTGSASTIDTADLLAGAALTTTPVPATTGAASFAAGAELDAAGAPGPSGTPPLSAGVVLTFDSEPSGSAAPSLSAGATFSPTGGLAVSGTAPLTALVALTTAALPAITGHPIITAAVSLSVRPSPTASGAPALSAGAVLTVFGSTASRQLSITVHIEPDRWSVQLAADRWLVALEDAMPDVKRIDLTNGAVKDLVADVTELNSKDLSGTEFRLSLGSRTAPGEWQIPTDVEYPAAGQAKLTLRVGEEYTVPPGSYYLWVWIVDGSEREPYRVPVLIVIL